MNTASNIGDRHQHAIESGCRVKCGHRTMAVITEPDKIGLFDTRDLHTGHQEYFRSDEVEHVCGIAVRRFDTY